MPKHSHTTPPVTSSVTQPPCENFSSTVMMRMMPHKSRPKENSKSRRMVRRDGLRVRSVYSSMPSIDSEKVKNTLMEYMTTMCDTSPRV